MSGLFLLLWTVLTIQMFTFLEIVNVHFLLKLHLPYAKVVYVICAREY